jgi:hypothetical protein
MQVWPDWRQGDDLWPLEVDMVDRATAGRPLDLGQGPLDPDARLEVMHAWGPERTIRAAVLRHVLVDKKQHVHAKGVRIRGIRISGCLDLEGATLRRPLRLDTCYLDGPQPDLDYATVSLLALTGCQLAGFSGDTLTVTKGLSLGGSMFTGPVLLRGAEITGNLDCGAARLNGTDGNGNALIADGLKVGQDMFLHQEFTAAGAIRLVRAGITGNLDCSAARLTGTDGDGNALIADGINVGGDAFLNQQFAAGGAVSLIGAGITGNLDCGSARLYRENREGSVLKADGLKVGGDVFLTQEFSAAGALIFIGADIGGNLDCTGAQLNRANDDQCVLDADMLKVGADVFLDQGFTAAGAIRLLGADIGGNLDCSGAQLNRADPDGNVLVADTLKVGQDFFLSSLPDLEFIAAGGIWLVGADIGGNLECSGAQLNRENTGGNALVADGIHIGGDAFLNQQLTAAGALKQPFTAAGALSLVGADITGNLDCSGACLNRANADSNALIADGLKVGHNVFLRNGFAARGTVRLLGADISDNLDCDSARLYRANADGNALVADGLKVGHNVSFRQEFMAVGAISVKSADVGGSFWLSQRNPADDEIGQVAGYEDRAALDATGAQIGHQLHWLPTEQVTRLVILEDATVGQLQDAWVEANDHKRPNGYWPSAAKGLLRLDGFTYKRIAGDHQAKLGDRLEWVGSQPRPPWRKRVTAATRAPRQAWSESRGRRDDRRARRHRPYGFAPQPYEQLAGFYQQVGQDREARTVALARRRDLRLYGELTPYRRAVNWLLDKTIQYGYQTWRAIVGVAVLYAAILALFWYAQHRAGLIVPVQSIQGLHPKPTAANCTRNYPCFSPVGYAIDTVIPIVNVHQADYWGPNASARFGWFFVYASWAGIVLGWTLATLTVAGYTNLVRNTDAL